MARRSDGDENPRGWLPRFLDASGQGMLLAGIGLAIAAGGLWYGVTLVLAGLAARAAGAAIVTSASERQELMLPPPRSPREGQSPEHGPVQLFEIEQAGRPPQFTARLEEEQRQTAAGRSV